MNRPLLKELTQHQRDVLYAALDMFYDMMADTHHETPPDDPHYAAQAEELQIAKDLMEGFDEHFGKDEEE